jgi:hypothetical protein
VSAVDRTSLVPLLTEMESRLFPDGKTRLLEDPTASYVGVVSPDASDELADGDEALVGAAE